MATIGSTRASLMLAPRFAANFRYLLAFSMVSRLLFAAAGKTMNADWIARAEMLEYTANANPPMSEVPVRVFPPSIHQNGPTRVEQLDLRQDLNVPYAATAPNLLASFVRIKVGEELGTGVDYGAT